LAQEKIMNGVSPDKLHLKPKAIYLNLFINT